MSVVGSESMARFTETLFERGTKRFVRRGKMIHAPGESADCIFSIREGLAGSFHVDEDGRDTAITIGGPGSLFGFGAFVEQNWRLPYVPPLSIPSGGYYISRALTDVVAYRTPVSDFDAIVRSDPDFALAAFTLAIQRLRDTTRLMGFPGRNQSRKRLVVLLILLAEKVGRPTERGILIDVRLSHQNLADMVRSTRPTVTKELADLRGMGLLIGDHHMIEILEPVGMVRLLN